MSAKRFTEGHQLRHWLRENWPDKVPSVIFCSSDPSASLTSGKVRPYPDDRRSCFTSMFHLTIENSSSPGYYTEKLMDCFRMRCVPLYWGAPDIADTFDKDGMIILTGLSKEEIIQKISTLTKEDYISRQDAINRNAAIVEEVVEGHNPFPVDTQLSPGHCRKLSKILNGATRI